MFWMVCVCVSERSILIIFAHDQAKMTISRIDRQHEQQIRWPTQDWKQKHQQQPILFDIQIGWR